MAPNLQSFSAPNGSSLIEIPVVALQKLAAAPAVPQQQQQDSSADYWTWRSAPVAADLFSGDRIEANLRTSARTEASATVAAHDDYWMESSATASTSTTTTTTKPQHDAYWTWRDVLSTEFVQERLEKQAPAPTTSSANPASDPYWSWEAPASRTNPANDEYWNSASPASSGREYWQMGEYSSDRYWSSCATSIASSIVGPDMYWFM